MKYSCSFCSKEITRYFHPEKRNSKHKYCNRKCLGDHRRILHTGQKRSTEWKASISRGLKGYKKTKEHLEKIGKAQRMEKHWKWQGGVCADSRGYLRRQIATGKTQKEHRFIVEQILGRTLKRRETIHHIDGNRSNNDLSNLYLFRTPSAHSKFEGFMKRHKLLINLKSNLHLYEVRNNS